MSYDEDKNAYLATLGPEQFYIPLGLASMDLLVEQGAFSEVAETDPHDLVSYGSSIRAKFNNEQGLMLMPDMDKDNLPANTYLKATSTETITYDVDTNTFLRESGT